MKYGFTLLLMVLTLHLLGQDEFHFSVPASSLNPEPGGSLSKKRINLVILADGYGRDPNLVETRKELFQAEGTLSDELLAG